MKKNYVAQLVFSPDFKKVVLITKLKGPRFLIGKMNGQGGVIEDGETAAQAATRETREESDLRICEAGWTLIDHKEYEDATISFFFATADLSKAKTMEAEPVIVMDVAILKTVATINPACVAPDLMGLIEKVEDMTAEMRAAIKDATPALP